MQEIEMQQNRADLQARTFLFEAQLLLIYYSEAMQQLNVAACGYNLTHHGQGISQLRHQQPNPFHPAGLAELLLLQPHDQRHHLQPEPKFPDPEMQVGRLQNHAACSSNACDDLGKGNFLADDERDWFQWEALVAAPRQELHQNHFTTMEESGLRGKAVLLEPDHWQRRRSP